MCISNCRQRTTALSWDPLPSQQTFLLALDGDVDFSPEAVLHLLDAMERDSTIGAACGQIHPLGSGVVAGYQKFEYALGHWLQKPTEDILGNVLCSPGCFSLFRLDALVTNRINVDMGKFDKQLNSQRIKTSAKMNNHMKNWERKMEFQQSSLEKYSTPSTEAVHSIQYDHGEDRWLCTLLITRGWKVRAACFNIN